MSWGNKVWWKEPQNEVTVWDCSSVPKGIPEKIGYKPWSHCMHEPWKGIQQAYTILAVYQNKEPFQSCSVSSLPGLKNLKQWLHGRRREGALFAPFNLWTFCV